jgi:acyl-CoA reductase-like NAD-dependent aldehyde dehydrogenase
MIPVRDPWDLSVIGEVLSATPAQIDATLARAWARRKAPPPVHVRAEVLDRAAQALAADAEAFSQLLRAEAGKPIALARAEVERAVGTLRLSAAEARGLAGEAVPIEGTAAGAGRIALTLREPLGVLLAITPFNFPLNLVAHKLGPAFAAGCPTVLKPAEKTPLSAERLVRLLHACGAPEDMVAIVHGTGPEVVPGLLADSRVGVLSFTGSGVVGRRLQAMAGGRPVLLELGGAAAAIVDEGVDVESVARALAAGAFGYAGQSCISVQRVLAHRSVASALEAALARETLAMPVGHPAGEAVRVGPMIRPEEAARVREWAREAVQAGARGVCGGMPQAGDPPGLLRPLLLAEAPPGARVSRQEVFGPLAVLFAVQDLDEAVQRANTVPGALNVGLYTRDLDRALRATRTLEAGAVLWNESPTWRADSMPYGGTGEAANTREGPRWAVRALTREKLLVLPPAGS